MEEQKKIMNFFLFDFVMINLGLHKKHFLVFTYLYEYIIHIIISIYIDK